MPVGIVPKQRRFSIGLLRNNGTGLERLVTVSLMVGAICSIIGVSLPLTHVAQSGFAFPTELPASVRLYAQ